MNKILKYILIIICLLSSIGAIVYFFYALNNFGIFLSLLFSAIIFIIILLLEKKYNKNKNFNNDNELNSLLLLKSFYLVFILSCFYILYNNRISEAIISPWQVLPNYFFILYALSIFILIIISIKSKKQIIWLIYIHYFLSFSVAIIVYKLGYGFDPFIHNATMELIDKNGFVEPKPFYYLGQYSFIIILHKISFLPIALINKFLTPVLASIYLPILLQSVLKKYFNNNKNINLTIIALLIIPFGIFISTTPQSLAYLFLILTILYGLICKSVFDLIIIYLLAFTALFIQPIAGIPAIIFTLFLTIYHSDFKKIKNIFYIIISFFSVISLPLAFWFVEKNNATVNTNLKKIQFFTKNLIPKIPNSENFILNFIYLYAFNLKYIISFIVITGIIIAIKNKKQCKIFIIYFISSVTLFFSYFLTKHFSFNFLISYERSNYANRILTVACIFLLPFILIAIYGFFNALSKQNKIIKNIFLIFIVILITTSFYISYPRFDNYYNSHGYSISNSDIKAVHWIENQTNSDYIVLSNQQVSVTALREFGFKKYYKNNIFYYPIPTGGQLYQYYLDMVYKKPSKQTMLSAMKLAGVNEGYFILNKYWWAFPKILREAKLEADSWIEIDNGNIFIFYYEFL